VHGLWLVRGIGLWLLSATCGCG